MTALTFTFLTFIGVTIFAIFLCLHHNRMFRSLCDQNLALLNDAHKKADALAVLQTFFAKTLVYHGDANCEQALRDLHEIIARVDDKQSLPLSHLALLAYLENITLSAQNVVREIGEYNLLEVTCSPYQPKSKRIGGHTFETQYKLFKAQQSTFPKAYTGNICLACSGQHDIPLSLYAEDDGSKHCYWLGSWGYCHNCGKESECFCPSLITAYRNAGIDGVTQVTQSFRLTSDGKHLAPEPDGTITYHLPPLIGVNDWKSLHAVGLNILNQDNAKKGKWIAWQLPVRRGDLG